MSDPRSRRHFLRLGAGLGVGLVAAARADAPTAEAGPPEGAADAGAAGPLAGPSALRSERPASLFSGAPEPDDPLELLYSRRLSFDEGQPLITVRVLEGRDEAVLRALGPLAVFFRAPSGRPEPLAGRRAAGRYTLRLLEGRPGVGATWVELEQVRYSDKDGREAAQALWTSRGVKVRLATVGDVYGIAGHVVDTRRWSLLAEGDATEQGARDQARKLGDQFGIRPQLYRELAGRPQGRLALVDGRGRTVGEGHGAIELRCARGLAVDQVEYGMGYSFHGFERRLYPGRLFACVDAEGKLALVAALPMERLVKGVVPSEIFARAHREALKAQAVTARGEVLAKVGARHLGDPYLLCAEQHCQVYKGISSEERATDQAVDATRGEALFARAVGSEPRRLVDSVYSAVCGGFTEDNEAVWGGPADQSLRGRPDFPLDAPGMERFRDGIGEALVGSFVDKDPVPSFCALSGMAPKDKVRWHRSFTQAEVDALCAPLEVGAVVRMTVESRGISGRARSLLIEGSRASTRVLGELNIRKQFKMLPSGMFVVALAEGRWSFTGGGWGHGSGMCQTGAIGRALRGQGYREILGWYYSGSTPERVY